MGPSFLPANPVAQPSAPLANIPTPNAAPTGMFGGGKFGLKQALAFGLAGLVARRNPALLQGLMSAMMQKQRDQMEEAQYQRHRRDALEDYAAKQKIDLQYPTPGQPSEYERGLIAQGIVPGSPEWAQHMRTRTTNLEDPVVMTPQGPMLRSQLLQGGQAAPAGVTFTPINEGGPTPGASGGFPHY